MNLPRVNELLEDDKEKFNIPEDSSKKIVILICLICISMISSALYKCPVCVGRGYITCKQFLPPLSKLYPSFVDEVIRGCYGRWLCKTPAPWSTG